MKKVAYGYKYEELEINIDDSPDIKSLVIFLTFLKLNQKILWYVF